MRTFRLLNQEQANKEAIPSQTCFSPCISGTCPPARTLLLGEHRFQPRLETTDRTPGPQPLLRSCDKVHQQNKYFSFNRWRKHGSLAASPEEFAFSLWAVSHTFKDLLASPTLRWSGSWDVGCFLFLFSYRDFDVLGLHNFQSLLFEIMKWFLLTQLRKMGKPRKRQRGK